MPPPLPYRKPPGRPGLPAVLPEQREARTPAELEQVVLEGPDSKAGASDRRDPRAGRRVVGGDAAELDPFVPLVAGGEIEADALSDRLLSQPLLGLDRRPRGRQADGPVGVRDDRGLIVVEDSSQGVEQTSVARIRRPVVGEAGPGGHRVDRLEVEGLLPIPTLAVCVRAPGHAAAISGLRDLSRRQPVPAAVCVHIADDRRGREGIDDRDGLAAAVGAGADQAVDAVGALELVRLIPAHDPWL